MQLRLPLLAFLFSSTLISVAEADSEWKDGLADGERGELQLHAVHICLDDYENPPTLNTFAGYELDRGAPEPLLGQAFRVHGIATNASCRDVTVSIALGPPRGATVPAQPPVCLLHNSKSARATVVPCDRHTVIPGRGADGGYNYLEVQARFAFNEPYNGPFEVESTLVEPMVTRTSRASVQMIVPQPPPPPVMVGSMLPPGSMIVPTFQPTPLPNTYGVDLMLVGSALDAGTLPVAFSNDDGSFTVTNFSVGTFASRAREGNVTRLAADFNGDQLIDVALVGGANWTFIPVAMAIGNGNFTVTEFAVTDNFGALAAATGVKPVAGDFDGDGTADIALVGGSSPALPIASSRGDGTFSISFASAGAFPTWARAFGARPIVGKFNIDPCDDIALVGGDGWTMLPHVYSNCNGTFTAHNAGATGTGFQVGCVSIYTCGIYGGFTGYEWNFARTVNEPGAQVVAADFNNDQMTDIAVTGTSSAQGLRIAFSYGNGSFQLLEVHDTTWAALANTSGATVRVGDFNGDYWNDFALTGVSGWNQLPLQLNAGRGTFSYRLWAIGNFGSWAAMPGARVVVGDFNGDYYDDLAVTGVSGWNQIPVAMNTGNGFNILQQGTARFPAWTPDPAASLFVGSAN